MTSPTKVWTVLEVLRWSQDYLAEKEIAEAKRDSEILLMAVLDCERIDLYTRFDRPLDSDERARFKAFILRRASREPVQYITGFTYFMGQRFDVTPDVLIPRSDTEVLVETVVDVIRARFDSKTLTVVDVGCGSGAIAISLAKYLEGLRVIGIDISDKALALAKKNSELNGVSDQISFMASDILNGLIHHEPEGDVIIVSNPPYITDEDYQKLDDEVRVYEPKTALYAGSDNLSYYRKIVDQASMLGDSLKGLFFETGYDSFDRVQHLMKSKYQIDPVGVHDLGQIGRVVYTLL